MKAFTDLTVGEIKALTEDQIDKYAVEVGAAELDNIALRMEISRKIGRRVIEHQIAKLKAIDKELMG